MNGDKLKLKEYETYAAVINGVPCDIEIINQVICEEGKRYILIAIEEDRDEF